MRAISVAIVGRIGYNMRSSYSMSFGRVSVFCAILGVLMREWLFRPELGFRGYWGFDCTGCIQREINRWACMPHLAPGTYRIKRPLDFRPK